MKHGLCLALLGLGVSTGYYHLTYVACGGLAVCLLGLCGICMDNICMYYSYVMCMSALTVACLWYIINPATVKPIVAEPMEQLLVAVYLKSGSLKNLPCCPKIPLELLKASSDWESRIFSEFIRAGNKLVCASTKLAGLLTCGEFIDLFLDAYGTPLAIFTAAMVVLCLGLLGLGLSTGLTLLTYVGCGGLIIGLLGWGGNRCMLLSYSWCMFAMTVTCLFFIIKPETVKPAFAEPLEQLLLAIYLKRGSLEDMPCCPKIPLERPRDFESWLATKLVGAGNQLVCAGTKLVGLPTCKELIDIMLDTYGTPVVIAAAVLMLTSGVNALNEAQKILKRSRSASPTPRYHNIA